VRLSKRTETAIDWDDRKLVRFLCKFSAKKCVDIETMFLAGKVGFCCFHRNNPFSTTMTVVRGTGSVHGRLLSATE
jgi:hypothetical protein